jgi:hypothetical protein
MSEFKRLIAAYQEAQEDRESGLHWPLGGLDWAMGYLAQTGQGLSPHQQVVLWVAVYWSYAYETDTFDYEIGPKMFKSPAWKLAARLLKKAFIK